MAVSREEEEVSLGLGFTQGPEVECWRCGLKTPMFRFWCMNCGRPQRFADPQTATAALHNWRRAKYRELRSQELESAAQPQAEVEQSLGEHLAAPSFWPFMVAVGVAMSLVGILIKPFVVAAGVIILALGAGLWVRDSMREFRSLSDAPDSESDHRLRDQ